MPVDMGLVKFLFSLPHKMGTLIWQRISEVCLGFWATVISSPFRVLEQLGLSNSRSRATSAPSSFPLPESQLERGQRFPLRILCKKNTWTGRLKVWIWSLLDSWSDPLSCPRRLSPIPLQLLFSLLPKGTKVNTFPQKVFSSPALESFSRVWAPMRDQVGDTPGLRSDTWGSAASHRENKGVTRHPLTWADALMWAGRAIPVLGLLESLLGFRGPKLNIFGSPEPKKWQHGLGELLVGNNVSGYYDGRTFISIYSKSNSSKNTDSRSVNSYCSHSTPSLYSVLFKMIKQTKIS